MQMIPNAQLLFPVFDIGATLLWAFSGALLGARRGFDITGIFMVGLVSSTGGGLLRDGLFLQDGPPVLLRTPTYLEMIVLATVLVLLFGRYLRDARWFESIISIIDALGIGAYSVVGMNLAGQAGLPTLSIIVVGMANAVGGSILRDILLGEIPQLLKPGPLLGLASLFGCMLFVLLQRFGVGPNPAGSATVILVFVFRMAAMRFRLKSRALPAFRDDWSNRDALD